MPEVDAQDVPTFVTGIVGLVLERLVKYPALSLCLGPSLIPHAYPTVLRNRQTEVAAEFRRNRPVMKPVEPGHGGRQQESNRARKFLLS